MAQPTQQAQPKEVKMGRRGMPGPRPKLENPGKTFGRLMGIVMGRYGFQFVIVAICVVVNVFVQLKGTMFLQELIDDYITPLVGQSNPDFGPLIHGILRMAIIFGIGIICAFLQNKIMVYVGQGTLYKIRTDMFSKMERLPISYFDSHSHGDIMSMYTNDVDTLRQMIAQAMPQMLSSVVLIVGVVSMMLKTSGALTAATFGMIFVMFLVTGNVMKASGRNFAAQQQNLGKLNGHIEEMMEGQKVVKVFCHEEESKEQFDNLNEDLYSVAFKANALAGSMGPFNAQLGNVSFVLCVILGSAFVAKGMGGPAFSGGGALTIGALASFLQLNRSINMPISQVSQQFNSIIMALAGAERIFNLMDEEAEEDNGYVELVNAKVENGVLVETSERTDRWAWKHIHQADGTVDLVPLEGDVLLDTVDFSYTGEKLVLEDVSVYAYAGQKIAFVGSTGAGKTTITNLINRFYDIQDGKIRYDGINVNKIKKGDLRRSLGMVLQETHLFTNTVMENIRYGRLDATDEEVIAAAKIANADSFIDRLPDGYNTVLSGDGGNLSQGQRQLLAIARAAVADPPALILDEATSSIDTRTEKIVQAGMDNLMKGRTTFVIAHRLSTVKNADCIVVLEQGKIIEKGSHDDLLAKKGKYYQLYTGNQVTA